MKIQTVTVDLWGTLLIDGPGTDDTSYKGHRVGAFDQVFRGSGKSYSTSRIERAYDDSLEYLRRIWDTDRDVSATEHVKAILRGIDRKLAESADFYLLEALVSAYSRPLTLVPPAFDDTAKPALETLRASGVALALVSNTMRTPGVALRKMLARAGLLPLFGHVVFSDEALIRKPDPQIFHAALRKVNGDPATAAHVGDDRLLDVQGAHAAGMRAIQVIGLSGHIAPDADGTIKQFAELPAAIAALGAE